MKRFSLLLLLTALGAAGIAVPTSAQTFADASLTLERAVHAEMVSGDMDRAIALYREVAESMSASREDMAKALIALGRSYELTGSDEAVTVYNRLVSEFPDQSEAFLSAHDALARLAPSLPAGSAPAAERDYTIMLDDATFGAHNGPWGREHDISPDGKTIVFGAPTLPYRAAMYPELENELYFVESQSSVMRPVIEDAGDWVGADLSRWLPRWSPDGRQIIFKARMREGGRKMVFAKRDLVAKTTVLLPEVSDLHGVTWLPDSQRFIASTRSGFDVYSSKGTLIRHFDKDSVTTRLGSVSPNGRYLAYLKNNPGGGSAFGFNFNIWLLDLGSGEHVQVTRDNGLVGIPAWSRDNKAVYYTTGSPQNLYKIAIGSDEAPEQITFYNNATVLHPVVPAGTGELTFALVTGTSTVLTAPADAPDVSREVVAGYGPIAAPDGGTIYFWDSEEGLRSTSQNGADPNLILSSNRAELANGGMSLSPDGRHFAYFLVGGQGSVLYTLPTGSGTPRRVHEAEKAFGAPAWSPGSKELAFGDGPDLVVVPSSGGTAESIIRAESGRIGEITWSPDGKYIAATEGLQEYSVFAVNRQTGERLPLSSADDVTFKEALSWHPRSDRVSYLGSSASSGSVYETRVASLAGGPIETLFDGSETFKAYWGAWGPDGRYYFIETGGPGELFVYPNDGTMARPFIQPRGNRYIWPLPSWSRDGSVITWSEGSARTQIWSVTDRK
jgi:Tol biopolymer transport system component